MITKVPDTQESTDAIKTNFNFIRKEPTRSVKEAVKDNVQLSAEGIQKSEATYEYFKNIKELISPEQQENLEKLIADLKALQEESEITEEQKETLKNDLKATLQGAHKPSEAAVDNFVADLSEIICDGCIDYREIVILQEDINLLLNSANISDEQIEALKEDLQAIAESSNISKEDLETLWDDIVQVVESAREGIKV